MNPSEQDSVIDDLIDLMAELGILEIQVRELRLRIEPVVDRMLSDLHKLQ